MPPAAAGGPARPGGLFARLAAARQPLDAARPAPPPPPRPPSPRPRSTRRGRGRLRARREKRGRTWDVGRSRPTSRWRSPGDVGRLHRRRRRDVRRRRRAPRRRRGPPGGVAGQARRRRRNFFIGFASAVVGPLSRFPCPSGPPTSAPPALRTHSAPSHAFIARVAASWGRERKFSSG